MTSLRKLVDAPFRFLFRRIADGQLVEVEMSHAEYLDRYVSGEPFLLDDGTPAERDVDAERERDGNRGPMGSGAFSRPLVSRNLGCHTSQVAEFNEEAKRAGLTGVYYRPEDGRVELSSRGQRKKLMQLRGLRDNDGGYGDG